MASVHCGVFNAYNTGYGRYNAYFQYDSTTRWQRTITVNNARVYVERIGTGYTANRGATSGSIGGGNGWYNVQLWSGNSPASATYTRGTVSVGGYASWSSTVGVNVQCRGANASNWDTIYGTEQVNSWFDIACPTAGAPTFSVWISNITTTSARLNMSITNNPYGFWAIHWYNPITSAWINYSGYGNTGTWTYDMTGLTPGTSYNGKYQIVGAEDTELQGVVNIPFATLQNSAVTKAEITDIETTTNSTTLTINDFKSTERTIFEVLSKDGIDIPVSNIQQGVYVYANGTFLANASCCCTINKIDVTPGTTIGILTDFDIGTDSGFNFYNNDTFISGTNSGSLVATVPAGVNKCHINFNGTGTPSNITNAKLVTSGITPVRYIRVYQNGSTFDANNHLCQIEAYDRFGINRALGKTLTGHLMDGTQVTISNPNEATLSSLTNTYAGCGYNQRCYFQLDLGAEYDLKDVKVWRYYPDQRTYYETAIWGFDNSNNNTAIWHEYSLHGLYQELDSRGGVPLLIKKTIGLLPNKEYIIKSKSKTIGLSWSSLCNIGFLTKPDTVSVSGEQVINIGEIIATLNAQSSNYQVTENVRYQLLKSKNLLNSTMLINNANINPTTGVQESGTRTVPTDFISVIPSATYTLTRPVVSGSTGGRFYDINKNYIGVGQTFNNLASITFTVPSNAYYFKFVDEGNTLNIGYQLEFGSTATTYVPYLTPVGDYTEETLGKNKCDELFEQGSLSETGQPDINTARIRTKNYLSLKSNTQYVFNCTGMNNIFVMQYDKFYNLLSISGWQTIPYTFMSNANAKYYKIITTVDHTTVITPSNISQVQLEEGSIPTTYEAYTLQSSYLKTVNELTPLTNYIAVFAIKTSRSDIWSTPKLVSFTTLDVPSAFCKIIYPNDWAYNLITENGMATPKTNTAYWSSISDYFTPLEDGWGKFEFNGSQTSRWANAWINASKINVLPNTQYTVFVEVRNASGILTTTGQISINDNTLNGMFTTAAGQIRGNGIFKFLLTTKADLTNMVLRIYADSRAFTNSGSAEIRVMIVHGNYTNLPLTYHCYDDGSYKKLYAIKENNLFLALKETFTLNGVTITNNGDGSYTFNGTASENTDYYLANATALNYEVNDAIPVKKDDIITLNCQILSGTFSGTPNLVVSLRRSDATYISDYIISNGIKVKKTITEQGSLVGFRVYASSGQVFNNWIIKPNMTGCILIPKYKVHLIE